jgi:hypothetical protein
MWRFMSYDLDEEEIERLVEPNPPRDTVGERDADGPLEVLRVVELERALVDDDAFGLERGLPPRLTVVREGKKTSVRTDPVVRPTVRPVPVE